MNRRRRGKKGKQNFVKHQSASTVGRNTYPRLKASSGNWIRMQHLVHHHES
jgi:hypothetical protein